MRGNSVAVRIPRIIYQTTANSMLITAKSPTIERMTPKEIMRQSREYVRTLTPATPKIYTNSPTNVLASQTEPDEKLSFKALKISRKSEDRVSSKFKPLQTTSNMLIRNAKSVTKKFDYFDLFVIEKETDENIENQLFPKELNEKVKYTPSLCSYEYVDWGDPPRSKSKKRICQKGRGYFLNSPSNWNNRVEDSFIVKSRMNNLIEKPCFRFPRFNTNKSINKSLAL
jgi:hypothetical protein